MSPGGGMFELLKRDHARRWGRPMSWWNLFALIPCIFLLIPSVYNAWDDAQIAKRQQTTEGTIDGHDPPNHNRYSYTYSVNGQKFTGWAFPGNHEFFIGQKIIVYYDPIQPSESSAYDFGDVNPGGVVFIGSFLLVCVGFPFFIYYQRRSRKRAGTTPDGD